MGAIQMAAHDDVGARPGGAAETLQAAFAAQSASVRVRAATAALELAIKVETDDLAERVAALEAHQQAGACR